MAKNTGTEKRTDRKSNKKETDIDNATTSSSRKDEARPASSPAAEGGAERRKPAGKPASAKSGKKVPNAGIVNETDIREEKVDEKHNSATDIKKDTGMPSSRSRGRRRRSDAGKTAPAEKESSATPPIKAEGSEKQETAKEEKINTDIQKDTERPHSRSGRRRRPQRQRDAAVESAAGAEKKVPDASDVVEIIDTGSEKATDRFLQTDAQNDIKKETDIEKVTENKPTQPKSRKRTSSKKELSKPAIPPVPEEENEQPEEKAKLPTGGRRFYDPAEFAVVQMMNSLAGFAPLGLLFVLMDVLNGAEEGMIRVNRLAASLGIGKPAMLAQLENLEKAGLMRTVSSSQRGRHVELLVPNLVICKKLEEARAAQEGALVLDIVPRGAPKNFSLDKLRALHAWLSEHGIRVVSLPDESDLDPKLAEIAAFLGKYLAFVQAFYSRLKATLGDGEEIQFSLLGFEGRDITHTLNFCKMLQDAGMLSTFAYRRAPHYKIIARLNRTPSAINFLSGGWLEHYIRDRVVAILTAHPATHDTPFAFMKNPRLVLPGDEDFEFDFLLMVGEKVFWIEAKTGDYLEYLSKYSRVSKLLGLGRDNSLLVLVDAPPPDAHLSARYGLNCCSVEEFAEVFRISLVRELGKQSRRSR